MSQSASLEERIVALEHEVARLKQSVEGSAKPDWIDRLTGSFKDDADFDEIVRLGQEYRKSQRPETHG